MCLVLEFVECLELGDWVFSFGIFGMFGIGRLGVKFWNFSAFLGVLGIGRWRV